MGISTIITTATSGLQAVQTQLQWRTDNVSNAQDLNYARRDAVTVSVGTHTVTVDVRRAVDAGTMRQLLNSNSLSSATATCEDYYKRLADVIGTAQSTPYLQQTMDDFTGAWKSFEIDPTSPTSEAQIISTGEALANTMTEGARNMTTIETEVRGEVGTMVGDLNNRVSDLSKVNLAINADPLAGSQDPGLFDKRDALVRDISSFIGIVPVFHSNGSVALYTKGGSALIDNTANQFQWNSPPGAPPWLSMVGTNIGTAPGLNNGFIDGKIGAALNFLDTSAAAVNSTNANMGTLAKARAQYDIVASQLADSYAPSIDRTGTTNSNTTINLASVNGLAIGMTVTGTGIPPGTTIFGTAIGPPSIVTLSAAATSSNAGLAITYGLPGAPSSAQTFGGAYYAAAPDRTNDLLGGPNVGYPVGPTAQTAAGTAMSSFFTVDNTSPTSQSPSQSLSLNPSLINANNTVKRQSATAVIAALTSASRAMNMGKIGGTTNASPSITVPQTSGLIPGMMVSGAGIPAGTTILSVVNGTSLLMSNSSTATAATAGLTFGLASISASSLTYAGLTSSIANYQASAQSAATNSNTRQSKTTDTLSIRLSAMTGVNMDNEMAQLTVLQNSYAANAKVINTVQAMYDVLLGIVK